MFWDQEAILLDGPEHSKDEECFLLLNERERSALHCVPVLQGIRCGDKNHFRKKGDNNGRVNNMEAVLYERRI